LLHPGDHVPHVSIRTIDGATINYADLWQHKNLIFVSIPAEPAFTEYAARLERAVCPALPADSALVISHGALPDLPAPAVLVADKWGEIHYAHVAATIAEMPDAEALLDWLTYVRVQCPECQGEAR
jgi:hypothetical protein